MPALFNEAGVESDHTSVHLYAKIPRVPDYSIEKYSYVKQTAESDAKLAEAFRKIDWTEVTELESPSEMVDKLHEIFKTTMDKCYETNTTTRKSNQPQWIN